MKKRTPAQYADALYQTTKDLSGNELTQVIRVFAELLKHDRKLSKINQIVEAFEKRVKKENGVVGLDVIFAREPKKTLLKAIEDTFGGKVEMKTAVDENILGGMIVKTEDTILDASVKTRLETLAHTLTT
jgi:F-type H+-transporting ATPase subunit delta